MTKGKIVFQVDQNFYEPISITFGSARVVIFTQGNNKIMLQDKYIEEFEQAIQNVRRWSK